MTNKQQEISNVQDNEETKKGLGKISSKVPVRIQSPSPVMINDQNEVDSDQQSEMDHEDKMSFRKWVANNRTKRYQSRYSSESSDSYSECSSQESDFRKAQRERKDVVNKTIVRSLKRFYAREFEKLSGFKLIPWKEIKAVFLNLLKEHTSAIFADDVDFFRSKGISMEDLAYFMGILVSPDHYKSIAPAHMSELFGLFTGTLYKYSHSKNR